MDEQGRPTLDAELAPVEGRLREELLASADRAMYLAKGAGPGRYLVAAD